MLNWNRLALVMLAVTVAGLESAAVAQAPQPPPAKPTAQVDLGGSASDRPWAKAVDPKQQKVAIDLFREGNSLLKESLFVQAAAKYREALSHWNHPGVHYNLALALLNLDQPVEVFSQLEEAMRYGPAPLDADKFEHAGRYKSLIEKQLARVDVVCTQPGAVVTFDGQVIFTGPGHHEALVRVGQHTLVATKPGFVTSHKSPMLPPGQKTVVNLDLFTAEEMTHYRRRWANAMPWSVMVAGIVIAGVGGILHWQAHEGFGAYDRGIGICSMAGQTGGCTPDPTLAGKKTQAESLQGAAFAMYGIGAGTVVAGAVLAYFNRLRPYQTTETDKLAKVQVSPLFGPSGAGIVTTVHF